MGPREQIEQLEKVQKRATKIVEECRGMKYIDRLRFLDLPTLKYRSLRGDLILLHNRLSGPMDSDDYFPVTVYHNDSRTRGHSKKLRLLKFNGNLRKYSFANRVVAVWNSLPEEIVDARCVKEFKNRLDKHWSKLNLKFDWKDREIV